MRLSPVVLSVFLCGTVSSCWAQGPRPSAVLAPKVPSSVIYAVDTPSTFNPDVHEVPELQPWGNAAEALCLVWYPRITHILYGDDKDPASVSVDLYFKKDMDGVAFADGKKIQISANWVKKNPNDFGMVIHELTHIVQSYPNYDAGWLVEGIADYVRQKYFEPQVAVPPIDFSKAKYTDSYKTTAGFLIWVEGKYDHELVRKLNTALKAGKYNDTAFKEITGKDVATLWNEFAQEKK